MSEETLQPRSLGDSRGPEPPRRRDSGVRKLVFAAVLILLAGLGGIAWLGRRTDFARPPAARTPTPIPRPTPTPDPARRLAAERALNDLLEITGPLEAAAPEMWAGERWRALQDVQGEGDRAMADSRWSQAEESYREAGRLASALARELPEVPNRLIPRARAAIAEGRASEAVDLLQAVLQVEPDHVEAVDLLPRARNADRSFALLERAREHVEAEAPELAFADLNRLRELDDRFPGAAEVREEVEAALAARELRSVLGRAVAALDAGDPETARAAVEEAEDLAPENPAVVDLKRQVEEAVRQREVLKLKARAEALEGEGRWRDAYATWLEIASLDPDAPWVLEGRSRALRWRVVEEKLNRGLRNPGGAQAGEWVEEFKDREGWPEELDARAGELETRRREMTTPVEVTLVSDGETTIQINRVGRWKDVVRESVELLPGAYVAKGWRLGYRDVRVEFVVPPGAEGLKIEVVCTEGI